MPDHTTCDNPQCLESIKDVEGDRTRTEIGYVYLCGGCMHSHKACDCGTVILMIEDYCAECLKQMEAA